MRITRLIPFLTFAAIYIGMLPSPLSAITVLSTDSAVTGPSSGPNEFTLSAGIYSYAFNAGADSDMLVVALSGEWSGEAFTVSYGGVGMNIAAQSSVASGASIYYLPNPSATGSVEIDLTGKATVNGIGLGIASLDGAGKTIVFDSPGASDSGTDTINLTTNFADSFVMFAGDANSTAGGSPTLDSPLTSVRTTNWPADIGSNTAAAGYENGVAAGPNTYSWNPAASPRGIAAAAFYAVDAPPEIASLSPVDGATEVIGNIDPVLTFNKDVALTGLGTVTIKNLDDGTGASDVTIDLSNLPDAGNNVTVSGAELTILPAANFTAGTNYAIQISADAVVDQAPAPNAFAGILDDTTWNFSIDGTAPGIAGLSPADETADVNVGTELVLTFDEAVALSGSGSVTIIEDPDGSPVNTVINLPDASVTLDGLDLTIVPASNLNAGVTYAVNISNDAVVDVSGNAFAGIGDSTTWNFDTVAADATAPVISTQEPADDATNIWIYANIVATFDDDLILGSGNITIYNVTLGSVAATIDVTDASQVTLAGSVLTIDPTAPLDLSTEYAVQLDAGVVRNLNDLPNAAISDTTTWSFTTQDIEQAPIPAEFISVGDYTGTDNERIDAAIADAMLTSHKTVYFPNGTYALRSGLSLDQGTDTELHLIGESREGVFIIPDTAYLEANYNGGDWQNGGERLAHMINLSSGSVFDSVDVSIQNMTIDMRHQLVMGEPAITYNVVGHGIRIGTGWVTGQFIVNYVNIRNTNSYGVGIQDRDGHPKNNITLSNLLIERTGSDGVDTKEASGDGNRNLVIRNVEINQVGFLDTGAAPALDLRYRDIIIENVNIVSKSNQGINPGQSTTGINFRPWDNGPGTGIAGATVTNAYIRGTAVGMRIHSDDTAPTPHENIAISDFRIQGQTGAGIDILGTEHSGHTISDGFVDPAFGGAAVVANGQAVVTNVVAARWDPALTPLTRTTYESDVSLAGETYSPAWTGMVGSEQVGINPTAPGAGAFVFDVGDTGVMQVDYGGTFDVMDKLIVNGTLNLDGELRINTIDGAPSSVGSYQIFEADTITGSFDNFSLPSVPGLIWNTDNLATNGTISLEAPLVVSNSIVEVNSGSHTQGGADVNAGNGGPYSIQINAGVDAELLIVGVSTELGGTTAYGVSYDGNPMELLTPTVLDNNKVFILDLTETSYAGGDAPLSFTWTATAGGDLGVGWASVKGNLEPGKRIEVVDYQLESGAGGTQPSVTLNTALSSFNFINWNHNKGSNGLLSSSSGAIAELYRNVSIDSNAGAAAYEEGAAAGSNTYSWAATEPRSVIGVAFAVVDAQEDGFAAWASGGESFSGDANNDGVADGIAFLLGAEDPATDASSFLSSVSETVGNLSITFSCLAEGPRGASVLRLEYDGDLTAPWTSAIVPGVIGPTVVGNVSFEVSDGGTNGNGDALLNVTATINDPIESAGGKLFSRLVGIE